MNRFFQLALVLFIPSFFSHAIVTSKIADPSLAKCVQEQLSKIQSTSFTDVVKLKCHGMNISTLDGLQALTNLQSLSLFNNKLTHANLSFFKQLTYLNIANNKLNSITLVGLSKLQTLYLFKNKLTTVDFSGLKNLTKIRITNNQLKILDIQPLISLEKAYFFDNKLEELIVSGLPKLTFIELRQNPMPDEVYDRYDELEGITIIHDGNADDWK